MRFILTLLPVLLCFRLHAICLESAYADVWPFEEEIAVNPVFIIDLNQYRPEDVRKLIAENKIYLKNSIANVPLELVQVSETDFPVQFVVRPVHELAFGQVYELKMMAIDGRPEIQLEYTAWRVTKPADYKSPEWLSTPVYLGKTYEGFGCGPDRRVWFSKSIKEDASPVVVWAQVTDQLGHRSGYYLMYSDSLISIGHDMCGGYFEYDEGVRYNVQFSLMDACGNVDRSMTRALGFMPPTRNDAAALQDEKAPLLNKEETHTLILFIVLACLIIAQGLSIFYMNAAD